MSPAPSEFCRGNRNLVEENEHDYQEPKTPYLDSTCGNSGHDAVCLHWRANCHVSLELVATAAVRRSRNFVLASARPSDSLPDPVWWVWHVRNWPVRVEARPRAHRR